MDRHLLARRRLVNVLAATAALFVLAGGFIHLREWLDTYRHVPGSVPGAEVVRVGFPLNAAMSLLLAVAIVVAVVRRSRRLAVVTGIAAVAFQATSLAALVLSRHGGVLGWAERGWTAGADETRAVTFAALAALVGFVAIAIRGDRAVAHARRS